MPIGGIFDHRFLQLVHIGVPVLFMRLAWRWIQGTRDPESNLSRGVIATVDNSGKTWVIALTNRHPTKSVACTVKLKETPLDGVYKATLLTGDSPDAFNDIEHPNRVAPKVVKLTFKNGVANLLLHPLTLVEVALK
jgi:alpha-L-arabinofuranosidase